MGEAGARVLHSAARSGLLALGLTCAAGPAFAADVTLKLATHGAEAVRVPLLPPAQRRRALASLGPLDAPAAIIAFPRFDADAASRSAALRRARDGPPPGIRSAADRDDALDAQLRILTAFGEPADARHMLEECQCPTFPEKLRTARAAAYIERRAGTLANGRVADYARAYDDDWRTAAAIALHDSGSNVADESLVAAVERGDAAQADAAASALFDTSGPRVLDAMRSGLARGSMARPSVAAYLIAYGDASDIARISATVVRPDVMTYAAYLTRKPADVAASLLAAGQSFYAVRTLPAIERLDARDRAAQFAAYQKATVSDPGTMVLESAMYPSKYVAALLNAGKISTGSTPWVPWLLASDDNLQEVINAYTETGATHPFVAQLDYVDNEALQKAFDAMQIGAKLASAELDLAAHRTTTRAYRSVLDPERSGDQRRAFALADPATKTAISGLLTVWPQLRGTTLHLALNVRVAGAKECGLLGQLCANDSGNEYYRYMLSGGADMLRSVTAYVDGKPIEAARGDTSDDGWTAFDVPLGRDKLIGTYVTVDLAYLGVPPTRITYDFFGGEYARELTILERRVEQRDADAHGSGRASDWERAAATYEAMGRFDDAWARYQLAIAANGAAVADWDAAARMYEFAGNPTAAAGVRYLQVARNPGRISAWRDLAQQLYDAGRYDDAASAVSSVLDAAPDDRGAMEIQVLALYLSGKRTQASSIFEDVPALGSGALSPIWFLAEATAHRERATMAKQALATFRQTGPNADRFTAFLLDDGRADALNDVVGAAAQCRAQTYAGYHDLLAGDRPGARGHFRAALATGRHHQLEYRMAQVELAALETARALPWGWIIGLIVVAALSAVAVMRLRAQKRAVE